MNIHAAPTFDLSHAPRYTGGRDLISYRTTTEAPTTPSRFPGAISQHVVQTIGAPLGIFGPGPSSLEQARSFAMEASQARAGAKAIVRLHIREGASLQVFDTVDIAMTKSGTDPDKPGFGSPFLRRVHAADIPANAIDTSFADFQFVELVEGKHTFALPPR